MKWLSLMSWTSAPKSRIWSNYLQNVIGTAGNSNFKTHSPLHTKSIPLPHNVPLHYNCISSSYILWITAITLCIRSRFITKLKPKFQALAKRIVFLSVASQKLDFIKQNKDCKYTWMWQITWKEHRLGHETALGSILAPSVTGCH